MKFYRYFAECYGTIWIVIMTVALIGQVHINAGLFGLIGFPIISLIYAAFRITGDDHEDYLRQRIMELESTIEALKATRAGNQNEE